MILDGVLGILLVADRTFHEGDLVAGPLVGPGDRGR